MENFGFIGGGISSADLARLTILENNEYKVTYYEIISGTSGSLTVPSQATINAGEFGLSGNAILSKIDGSNKPTFQSPTTSAGVVVTASLNVSTGAWVASGTYTDSSVALIYSIKIKAVYYSNLTYSNIIETVKLNDITKYSYIDTSLGTLSSAGSLTLSKSVLIPANTLTSGLLNIKGRSIKTGTGSFGWLSIYVNTSNSMSGATQIGQMNNASNNTILSWAIERNIPIQSGSFTAFIVNGISGSENVITNTVSTVTINWTVNQYIILAVQANNGAESLRANFFSVNQF